jgi:hypothetical protein
MHCPEQNCYDMTNPCGEDGSGLGLGLSLRSRLGLVWRTKRGKLGLGLRSRLFSDLILLLLVIQVFG